MPGLSVVTLERHYGREKDPRAKLRLLAAMLRKKGRTMGPITEDLHIPVGTVHEWLRRLMDGKLKRLRDEHRSGRPSKVSMEELKELRRDLLRGPKASGFVDSPYWTTKSVQEHVKRKFRREYRARGMRGRPSQGRILIEEAQTSQREES